jgi:two-component sensor histidine kinase
MIVSVDTPNVSWSEAWESLRLPWQFSSSAHHSHGDRGDGEPGSSAGLGLAVARQLAHLMSGEPSYERKQHQTVFRLDLPEARANQAQLL